MAGRASHAAGTTTGRYNLRPRGRRGQGQGGLRGAAALADSPLLGGLLVDLTDVFDCEVLPLLDPATRALPSGSGRRAATRCCGPPSSPARVGPSE